MAIAADEIQVFVSSPDLHLPCRSLFVKSGLSFSLLKRRLLHLHPQRTLPADAFYLCSHGRLLPDSGTPRSSRLSSHSSITIHLRARGGGGDGGATGAESRDCYLNMYATKKPDKVDPNETRLTKWTTCALSFEPLAPPCVMDRLGNVFNKEALLQALLEKKLPKEFRHIRGLKDMIPVHLTEIPGGGDGATRFQCPITGQEFNGKYAFLALRGCGHVLSSKALKEVKTSACLVCHREFSDSDKLVVNGSSEEVKVLREKMEEEMVKLKEKKDKKFGASLSGTKHANPENVGTLENYRREGSTKKFKAVDIAPANANKEVYASIFTSSKKTDMKETYSCRSLPIGRN